VTHVDPSANRSKLVRVASAAFRKAKEQRPTFADVWHDLMALIRLVAVWGRGEYKAVPWRSIVMASGALLYFLDPFDAIPDAIPGIGFVDDGSVIALVAGAIKSDIERFIRWEQTRLVGSQSPRTRRAASPLAACRT
jgi:uncharacterized membrane protein YkvA (DUF1232 family)